MKRLAILFGLALLLNGCVVAPYGAGDGGYRDRDRDRGDWHDRHDDRGGDNRRDNYPNRY